MSIHLAVGCYFYWDLTNFNLTSFASSPGSALRPEKIIVRVRLDTGFMAYTNNEHLIKETYSKVKTVVHK